MPKLFMLLCLSLLAVNAKAQWQLNGNLSAVNFVTIKNASVGESHYFGELSGGISAAGDGELVIALDSVETLIPIRNERMRELLFNTANFPTATATTRADPDVLASLIDGGAINTELQLTLKLHGMEKLYSVQAALIGEAGGRLRLLTRQPVLVSATDFGLAAGVNGLREVAGLATISTLVPVSVSLVFDPVSSL